LTAQIVDASRRIATLYASAEEPLLEPFDTAGPPLALLKSGGERANGDFPIARLLSYSSGLSMAVTVLSKDTTYILNQCTKYLARDNRDERHNALGIYDGQTRARISEPWRFPVIDSHSGEAPDRYDWNDVTFIYAAAADAPLPGTVELLSTCNTLYEPVPLRRVEDSIYWACTLKIRKAERYRYLFIVDGKLLLDPINPQTETLSNGETWSSFFTWAYNQPISFERWEFVILERLTRHILPFKTEEAENFLRRGANEATVRHLYRLYESVGVANYIDKIVAREERHRLYAYKTCVEMIDAILRRRHPGKDPAFIDRSSYERLYDEMANRSDTLLEDGWDPNRYSDPWHFLYLLRRHAITGAFSHPKYGGNAGAMAWDYLRERYKSDDGGTAFNWKHAMEQPLGTSDEYRG
jgi:hypothetical protein